MMGARRVLWCSLVAGVIFAAGCGDKDQSGEDDGSVDVNQLEGHVGLHCSGNMETNQTILNSGRDISLGDDLHMRVFGELKEPVRVRWQLCAVPSMTFDHELTGKTKTGEAAVRYWVEKNKTGTATRIDISEYLVPGSRLEVYSKKDPNTFFLRVKGGGKKSTYATSIKDLDSDQARSVIVISKEDAELEGEILVDKNVIEFLLGESRLENKISTSFKDTGAKFKSLGATFVNTAADVTTHVVSAVGDIGETLVDGIGDIGVAATGLLVSVTKLAIDGVELGVGELSNLIKKTGSKKKGSSGPTPIEQICDAINPKLVGVMNRFCDFNEIKANSQSMQTCQSTMQNLLKKIKEKNNINIPYSSHYCTSYGHATVEFCKVVIAKKVDASTQTPSDKIAKNLLQACKTP